MCGLRWSRPARMMKRYWVLKHCWRAKGNHKPPTSFGWAGRLGNGIVSHVGVSCPVLSLYLAVSFISVYLCLCLYLRRSVPVYYPSVRSSVCLSVCLPVRLSGSLSVSLSVSQPVCLSVFLSVCLSVRPSVCLCLSVCLCVCMRKKKPKNPKTPKT